MKTYLLTILCLVSLFCAACPKQSDFVRAYRASTRVAGATEQAAVAVGDLYRAGVIDYATKEKLVEKLRLVERGGRAFHHSIDAVRASFGNRLPDDQASALDTLFNREVIAPFLDLLTTAGTLSENTAQKIFLAIAVIRQLVLTVANLFGQLRSGSASYEFYQREAENHG